MSQIDKHLDSVIDIILNLIKRLNDYSDDDMALFKRISIDNNAATPIATYYVRIEAGDIDLDFICHDIFGKPSVTETNFSEWPVNYHEPKGIVASKEA